MAIGYDKYYKTENLFGEPYPELIEFMTSLPYKGKLLDLGCGQGRDAIAIARLGFAVTGIDASQVGIDQMNEVAKRENLNLVGFVDEIYTYEDFHFFDVVLLDSMFHFTKKDLERELGFIQKVASQIKNGCILIFCIQDSGKKVDILNQALNQEKFKKHLADKTFEYVFEDQNSKHQSRTKFRLIALEK